MKQILSTITLFLLLQVTHAQAAEVVTLTQTACQIIEAEADMQHYKADRADACEAVNEKTGELRLQKATALRLKAGDYIFRVSNKDVPYALGFWLRGVGLSRYTLPSVSGGGLHTGDTKDYRVRLEAGEYRYSCPLNPTPDYVLFVD
ncbi:hypothetical protein F3F96_06280 [Mariprofundus sp. NF]|uniref:hypothetical protein n=1 Tax=Mariprofundus sp. NF TaxID=2608716 RepID=UPI0015A1CA6C|nr:hypothetical protein [Mariprofundus sp. NF]NWF38738.1 hypothetical protein [Mariprofundus sp. NF]